MTRSNAREIAVHLVYELHYTEAPASELLDLHMDTDYYAGLQDVADVYSERPNQKQMSYIRSVVTGVQEKRSELDAYIEKYAMNWKLDRISRISRAIMEVAIFELLCAEDVPAGVAINEAVELCKKYGEGETASFVNGILGKVAKEVTEHVSGT